MREPERGKTESLTGRESQVVGEVERELQKKRDRDDALALLKEVNTVSKTSSLYPIYVPSLYPWLQTFGLSYVCQ